MWLTRNERNKKSGKNHRKSHKNLGAVRQKLWNWQRNMLKNVKNCNEMNSHKHFIQKALDNLF